MPRRPSCSCRQFRHQHAEYVDGFLSEETRRACEEHLTDCAACARQDVLVRRSLLALQVLPVIEPSPGFRGRLAERLRLDAMEQARARPRGMRWGVAGVIVAASVAVLVVSSSRARLRPAGKDHATPIVAQALVPPVVLLPKAPVAGSVAIGRAASVTATAPKTITARFEALPGEYVELPNPVRKGSTAQFQTVSYQGQ